MLVLRVGGDGDALASAPSGALPVTQGAGTAEQLVFEPLGFEFAGVCKQTLMGR